MHRTGGQPELNRWRPIDHMPRETNEEILRQLALLEILLDQAVFTGRYPMLDVRRETRDLCYLLKHPDALQIPAIEPAEVRSPRLDRLPVHELHHRHDPVRVGELVEPSLVCLMNPMLAEVALERIAPLTDRSGNLSQLRAGDAGLRWNPPSVAGHLRRPGQPAHDPPRLQSRKANKRVDEIVLADRFADSMIELEEIPRAFDEVWR